MITLWAVTKYTNTIEPREYARTTGHCAFRKKRGREVRESLHQEYLDLFPSEGEAVEFLRQRLEGRLHDARTNLSHAEADLAEFVKRHGSSIIEVPASGMDELN